MKILLDENLPKKLKGNFSDHEVYTAREKGWNGKRNCELLKLMLSEDFNALISFDKNIKHQQNFSKFPIPVLVLIAEDNTYITLKELVPKIKRLLSSGDIASGVTEIDL